MAPPLRRRGRVAGRTPRPPATTVTKGEPDDTPAVHTARPLPAPPNHHPRPPVHPRNVAIPPRLARRRTRPRPLRPHRRPPRHLLPRRRPGLPPRVLDRERTW